MFNVAILTPSQKRNPSLNFNFYMFDSDYQLRHTAADSNARY